MLSTLVSSNVSFFVPNTRVAEVCERQVEHLMFCTDSPAVIILETQNKIIKTLGHLKETLLEIRYISINLCRSRGVIKRCMYVSMCACLCVCVFVRACVCACVCDNLKLLKYH